MLYAINCFYTPVSVICLWRPDFAPVWKILEELFAVLSCCIGGISCSSIGDLSFCVVHVACCLIQKQDMNSVFTIFSTWASKEQFCWLWKCPTGLWGPLAPFDLGVLPILTQSIWVPAIITDTLFSLGTWSSQWKHRTWDSDLGGKGGIGKYAEHAMGSLCPLTHNDQDSNSRQMFASVACARNDFVM